MYKYVADVCLFHFVGFNQVLLTQARHFIYRNLSKGLQRKGICYYYDHKI